MATPKPMSQRRLRAAERRAQVVQWKAEGATFAEIGTRLGVSFQRAHQIWDEALAAMPAPNLAQHRRSQLELIDTAVRELLVIARSEQVSPRTRVEAWGQIRGWEERRAKLLGADMPTRREVTVITEDVIAAEVRKLEAEMAAMDAQEALARAAEVETRGKAS